MTVAGVMSGTSGDGIDVALVRLRGRGRSTKLKLLAHQRHAYPGAVRERVLRLGGGERASASEFSRLNFLLGELYAEAVAKTQSAHRLKADLVGCHGQTLYHQGEAGAAYLGRKIRCTWQSGEAATMAARLGIPVITDFRPADLAAGGKGAPLVPLLDYICFRDPRRGRILQNLGGIGNLTAIPASAKEAEVTAFDTGPANMLLDALAQEFFHVPFDKHGAFAGSGKVCEAVVAATLKHGFFKQTPPRAAGREQFGAEFARKFVARCRAAKCRAPEDMMATAAAVTAASIGESLRRFVIARRAGAKQYSEFIVSGGGARNRTLMRMIAAQVIPMGMRLATSDEYGLPSQAKEAAAFALLAYRTWNREPGNMPSATGAQRAAILGKIALP